MERIWMCVMWKARGVQWQNAGAPIKLASPRKVSSSTSRRWASRRTRPDKDAAYAYLDALARSRPQQGFIDDMGYNPTIGQPEAVRRARQRIGSPGREETMLVQDYEYLARTTPSFKSGGKEFKS